MNHKVSELTGALLDAAVAECGEWKTAHEHFPTMTLDPTFSGWFIYEHNGESHCMLKPHNAFRQNAQNWRPSSDWSQGGPIIERERLRIEPRPAGITFLGQRMGVPCWLANIPESGDVAHALNWLGPTPLIAAMRAYVASKFGNEIDLGDVD